MIVLPSRRETGLHRAQRKPWWPYVLFGKSLGLEDGKEHRRRSGPFPIGMRVSVLVEMPQIKSKTKESAF